jgi:hypothetical protein
MQVTVNYNEKQYTIVDNDGEFKRVHHLNNAFSDAHDIAPFSGLGKTTTASIFKSSLVLSSLEDKLPAEIRAKEVVYITISQIKGSGGSYTPALVEEAYKNQQKLDSLDVARLVKLSKKLN